ELTPREREVLSLMAEGHSNAGIARTMTITEGAVEKYSARLFAKLDLLPDETGHRRVRAVLTWLQRG
ncbi:MAG: helix-turn-helix transcriptional regulator, partial [Marmoricola sp.]